MALKTYIPFSFSVFFIWLGTVCFGIGLARDIKLSVVPTIISGSFKPLRLEIDGKQVLKQSNAISELKINSQPIIPLAQKGSPFFTQSIESKVEVLIPDSPNQPVFLLPSASILEQTETELLIKAEGEGLIARINKKPIPIESGTIHWKLPTSQKYALYILELIQKSSGLKRTYNLEFLEVVQKVTNPLNQKVEIPAPVPNSQEFTPSLSWNNFTLGPILAYQSLERYSASLNVAWTPRYQYSPSYSIAPHLGGTFFKSFSTKTNFLFLETGANLERSGKDWGLTGGLFLQFWKDNGGIFPSGNLGVFFKIDPNFLGLKLDRVFIDYSLALTHPGLTHFIKTGVGIAL